MKITKARSCLHFLVAIGALLPLVYTHSTCAADTKKLLAPVKDVPLPGGATRFDYQSFDPTTGRLYLSHMGDGDVVVFDTQADKVVANVRGLPTVTGVLVVPSVKACYASVTGNHEIAVIDTEKLAVTKRIPDGKFPDGLAYSPETHKLFISDESGGVETVIDVRSNERIDTIKMGGEVGNTQYDPVSHLVYACVQTRNDFVEINPATNKIQARYPLPGSEHPHGFYIDDEHGKAYIDVLAFDRGLQLLYVACESGVVSVFKYVDDQLRKIGDTDVGPNSHSVSVDQKTHKIYFPLKNVNGTPLLRIMSPTPAN